jgi:hypothetical protein
MKIPVNKFFKSDTGKTFSLLFTNGTYGEYKIAELKLSLSSEVENQRQSKTSTYLIIIIMILSISILIIYVKNKLLVTLPKRNAG